MMKNIKQINRPTLKDQVYEALKVAIVNLELAPGQRLQDKKLAEQFAVSRTPVREALKRLEDEGLVESFPGSATRVTELVEEEAKNAFTVVATLHALATKLAIPKMTEEHFQQLEEINQVLKKAINGKESYEAIQADEQFHQVFLKAAKNSEIESVLERISPKIQRLAYKKFDSQDGDTSIQQHEQVIALSRLGKKKQAAELVEDNWLTLGKLLSRES